MIKTQTFLTCYSNIVFVVTILHMISHINSFLYDTFHQNCNVKHKILYMELTTLFRCMKCQFLKTLKTSGILRECAATFMVHNTGS